ncbi:Glu/Leu/Phe/Val family dehydrogenase [Gracilinema caldarium]|uniref:Glutamate dehydrogenase (NAD(P)(+)) n=1 Tax=Gracilinema caldarium (strain ATCC 51460 / DSM 7334 / H1) TaxID=744872 RepID=F8EWN6_GRAC1|nr:Glu/Leu/Phe/Val dehydrogenase dimerization domain-containing protein [Gracilinema caldarium]AEJ18199.1 Glutamate dehydrogenase (NAD(P)(+)) [Gracilinema caldarium DSM 7334]
MAEAKVRYQGSYLKGVKARVGTILETNYKLDINTREKILADYLSDEQLPHWYFYSNTPEEIARHLFIITQLLSSNVGQIYHVSDDSRVITYLINIGRDYPGRLERVIEENMNMRIASFDSESTVNGVRIVSLEKITQEPARYTPEQEAAIIKLKSDLAYYGENRDLIHTNRFIESLSSRYLLEEIESTLEPKRSERHLVFYNRICDTAEPLVDISDVQYEDDIGRIEKSSRVMIGVANPGHEFIPQILRIFEKRGINLKRTYFDLFRHPQGDVAIFTTYFNLGYSLSGLEDALKEAIISGQHEETQAAAAGALIVQNTSKRILEEKIESILRRLPSRSNPHDAMKAIEELKELCRQNGTIGTGPESHSFYLNSVTDFLEAARFAGIDEVPEVLRLLLGYEAFDEFFVTAQANGISSNLPGYRIKHSIARGPAKGGLRIDPIVSFDEVAALSFMMTWKCARSRILYGGAKGGLMLNPRTFEGTAIDYFDTLSSFGRSLFLVSGPMRDVPAGDVGCGPKEIGHMFEGFKSALRDLAVMSYGLKPGVTMIGPRIVSVQEARRMLAEHFDVDWTDPVIIGELVRNETYLELVTAAQITGKPKLGIEARGAATGLGMAYAVLAAVGNLYLDGQWKPNRPLSKEEEAVLRKACSITEAVILKEESEQAYGKVDFKPEDAVVHGRLLSADEWKLLSEKVYPALLTGKTLSVQGSGKVGGSLLTSLKPYGVKLIAIADAGGAIFGDDLDMDEVLAAVENSRNHPDKALRASCVHATKNVQERILGLSGSSKVLEIECDIVAPAALENAVTEENARRIKAKLEVCGANGPNSSRAEKILAEQGVTVLYDFLANGAGVTASYFEWLRNLTDRFRYEAERIRHVPFDISCMDPYVMPEFKTRLKKILANGESRNTTESWNLMLRDIMFAALNEDYRFAKDHKVSMKTAGFLNAQLRVLAATLVRMEEKDRQSMMARLPDKSRALLKPFMEHPEVKLFMQKGGKNY